MARAGARGVKEAREKDVIIELSVKRETKVTREPRKTIE
jgi:hypothetical protein